MDRDRQRRDKQLKFSTKQEEAAFLSDGWPSRLFRGAGAHHPLCATSTKRSILPPPKSLWFHLFEFFLSIIEDYRTKE